MQNEQVKGMLGPVRLVLLSQGMMLIISFVLILVYALILSYSRISDASMPMVTQTILLATIVISNSIVIAKAKYKKRPWLLGLVNGFIFSVLLIPFGMMFGQIFALDIYLAAKLLVSSVIGALGGIIGGNLVE